MDSEQILSLIKNYVKEGKALLSNSITSESDFRIWRDNCRGWSQITYNSLLNIYDDSQVAYFFGLPREFQGSYDFQHTVSQIKRDIHERLRFLGNLLNPPTANQNAPLNQPQVKEFNVPDVEQEKDVLISWSKSLSFTAAENFSTWISKILPDLEPWISSNDIEMGSVWFDELQTFLAGAKAAIIFLTKQNVRSPWIYYEAGAIATKRAKDIKIYPYLIGMDPAIIKDTPLGHYFAATSTKQNTLKLVQTLNKYSKKPEDTEKVELRFDKYWGEFEKILIEVIETASDKNDFIESTVDQIAGTQLGSEARVLLVEGSKDNSGVISKIRSDGGIFFLSNNIRYPTKDASARELAEWRQGLEELESHKLVARRTANSSEYDLTANGFKIADILKQQTDI